MLERIKVTKQSESYKAIIKRDDGTTCAIEGTVSLMKAVSGDLVFQDSFHEAK